MITLCFTYDVTTEESAREGDIERSGFYCPHRGVELTETHEQACVYTRPMWVKPGDLKDALRAARDLGICSGEGADWFYTIDTHENYQTGESFRYAFHVSGVTPSTFRRIERVLCGRVSRHRR